MGSTGNPFISIQPKDVCFAKFVGDTFLHCIAYPILQRNNADLPAKIEMIRNRIE
jgi:hypothetical protein